MTNAGIETQRNQAPRDFWLHVLLGLLGVVNVFYTGSYLVTGWHALHEQGIGHLYLFIVLTLCSWWFGFIVAVCFAGNAMLSGQSTRPLSQRLLYAVLGAGTSLFVPSMMIAGWMLVAVWIRSLL